MPEDLTKSPVFQQMVKECSGLQFDVKRLARRGYADTFGCREDAAESVMFARELEYVFAKTYDILYPGLKARQLCPVNTEVPTGADTHTYQQFDRVGVAKEVDDYAEDFPTVEVKGDQFTGKIVSLGDAYQYSTQDMRNAAMAKKPLDAMKASAARLAMEEKLERITATGSPARGITGLLNAPGVATQALTNGLWDTQFNLATDASLNKVQADVAQLAKKIWVDSKTVHGNSGLTLLVDTTTYAALQNTPQSSTFKDQSIAAFILRTVPALSNIDYWLQNDTANAGARQLMVYEKSPANCELIIPQEFEQFPPQLKGMAFKIFCHMRTGGVAFRRPKSALYATNHVG